MREKRRSDFNDVIEILVLFSVSLMQRKKERKIYDYDYDYDFPADGLLIYFIFRHRIRFRACGFCVQCTCVCVYPLFFGKAANYIWFANRFFSSVFYKTLFVLCWYAVCKTIHRRTHVTDVAMRKSNKSDKREVVNRHRLNLRHLNKNQSAFHRIVALLHTLSTQANRTV